jgi:LacI family transcriptional regulator
MRGVEEVASEFGYLTIMCNSERKPERELHYLRILRDYRTDGILFAGGGLNEPGYPERLEVVVRDVLSRGAAVVTLAQHTLSVPSVQPDNFGGAQRMTNYLLQLGHERIAFVSGPANVTAADARLQGYRAALTQAGKRVEQDLMLSGSFDRASGERAAEAVARREAEMRPTAIFAANDETAIGVLSGLVRLGVSVPGDISVCGFGDLPAAQIVAPTLTTVRIDLRALGRTGTRALLAQLRHEEVTQLQVLPTSIVERASTAPLTNVKGLRDG